MRRVAGFQSLLTAAALFFCSYASALPILQTSDFIADGDRTNFVGFEGLSFSALLPSSYSEDGVEVNQRLGKQANISSVCASACFSSPSGQLSWYPNGGDNGYTEITRTDGSDFLDVGLTYGGKTFVEFIAYELLSDGVSVLFGSFANPSADDGYIGFSGGGFDTVRLAGPNLGVNLSSFGDGTSQALPIDDIELRSLVASDVPVPVTLALFGLGLAGLGLSRRKKA